MEACALPVPRLPRSGLVERGAAFLSAGVLHAAAAVVVAVATRHAAAPLQWPDAGAETPARAMTSIVFLQPSIDTPAGGGGGGGNHRSEPIRRASGRGNDAMTLHVRPPSTLAPLPSAILAPELPGLVLDAKPLASGTFDQIGLPMDGPLSGASTGPGSGGGVGDGEGAGIGPGRGPGFGAGEGGGIGGGVYGAGE